MAADNAAIFAIFAMRTRAEAAIDRLTAAGFSSGALSLLISDQEGSKEFATKTSTKAAEDAITGAEVGAVVGGTMALLAGLNALAMPGVGSLIAAGPILASLAGLGAGAAVGGLVGALVGLGIPEYEAKLYEGRLKDGDVLLSVRCAGNEELSRARDLLAASGAEDIAASEEETIDTEEEDPRVPSGGVQLINSRG
jgi:hypothetical protein